MENRILSKIFTLTEHDNKYGINRAGNTPLLYPVYDSIWELDNYDFIIEQNGKFGYAYLNDDLNDDAEIELILPLYDAIIKEEHGLSLIKRVESEYERQKQYSWYDTKSRALSNNLMRIKALGAYDLFVSTKKCDKNKPPILKKWGKDISISIPYGEDILYELAEDGYTHFVAIKEIDGVEYEYALITVAEDGEYTVSVSKQSIEELYKHLPNLMEDAKCSLKTKSLTATLKQK